MLGPVRRLYGEEEIAQRVEALAQEIAAALPRELVLVGLLKGSFVFLADLLRALSRQGAVPRVEFMRLASYGAARTSSGRVTLEGTLPKDLAGRNLLLVDDILDSGRTLAEGLRLLAGEGPAALATCALLDKPSRREVAFEADFVGFRVPDLFLVGYGLDCAEEGRHLPFVGVLEE